MLTQHNIEGTESLTVEDWPPRRGVQRVDPAKAAAAASAAEQKRHAERAEIKEQIAEAKLAEERWNALRGTIQNVTAKKFEVAHDLTEERRLLSEELAEIDRLQLDCATNGEADDPARNQRWREIKDRIHQLNRDIADRTAPFDEKISDLEKERFEWKQKTGFCHLQFQLIALARPDLYAESRLTLELLSQATRNLDVVKSRAEKAKDSPLAGFWKTKIAEAEQQAEKAKADHEKALQAVYDE